MILRRLLFSATIYVAFNAAVNYYVDNNFNVTINITKDMLAFSASSSLAYLCYMHFEPDV
jgi:hypothetical protein